MSTRAGSAPHRAARPAAIAALSGAAVGLLALASCAGPGSATAARAAGTGAEHGLVLTRTAGAYLMVMNVPAPEPERTSGDLGATEPADGEQTRRLAIHVYDLRDGEPARDVTPSLTFVDHTTGRTQPLDATVVHDLALGDRRDHFATTAALPAGHRFTLRVGLDGTTTEFTGVVP